MCLDWGCGEPNDRHGDDRHITLDDIQAAAQGCEISVDEAKRNIIDALSQPSRSSTSED